jgi:hypothetical protein
MLQVKRAGVVRVRQQLWDDWLTLYPSAFVESKRLRALAKSLTGYSVLLYHLAPNAQRYEGIDGRCHDRSPGRSLYGFLSGVFAACLGLRVSYRLIAKGDDCTYFHGLITWVPFSFLCTTYGFGALVECVFCFTNPCDESHVRNTVTQKYLTSVHFCNTLTASGSLKPMANILNKDKQIAIIGALAEGSSIRSIERMTGVHRDTIMRLGVKAGSGCEMLLDSKMQDLGCRYLQFDELWGFIGKKERHVRISDDPEMDKS